MCETRNKPVYRQDFIKIANDLHQLKKVIGVHSEFNTVMDTIVEVLSASNKRFDGNEFAKRVIRGHK